MNNTVTKPVWADTTLRIDPSYFPQQISYAVPGSDQNVTVTIDERGAVMRKQLSPQDAPMAMALPKRVFEGVAARAMDHGNGQVTVTLELYHANPDLCVPLLVAHDLSDIASDWRAWSEIFDIPMLMVEADGVARPLDAPLETAQEQPKPQRSYHTARVPRFRMRFTNAKLGLTLKIGHQQVVAR